MIESIEKPQESIRKNRNPHRVIPAQAGIQKHNAAGLYRKKPKPHRPSFPQKRESKNATQQEFIGKNRNPTAVIPAKAGIQKRNATGIHRKKQKPHRPSFPQKLESSNRKTTGIYQQKQKPPPRHSRKSWNPKTQRNRNLSEKTETPPTVIPAKAGIQTRRHGILPDKTVSLDSTS
ncbi:putative phage associated protein [Neisseria meningitidis]|uniref:hypothetical protein n=1 Tax=Neisseria meningitidis TaxID=487 RepID=UPI0007666912|nr:hypothetical protein [Neisseria meningitidis]CWO91951.1 putative phage associated protein [Neisseria meningitidis]